LHPVLPRLLIIFLPALLRVTCQLRVDDRLRVHIVLPPALPKLLIIFGRGVAFGVFGVCAWAGVRACGM
jgi:hypothetical protein